MKYENLNEANSDVIYLWIGCNDPHRMIMHKVSGQAKVQF